MEFTFTTDKPQLLQYMWEIMETVQDKHPYTLIGWNGFTLMVFYDD